jgi:hypothetical protein
MQPGDKVRLSTRVILEVANTWRYLTHYKEVMDYFKGDLIIKRIAGAGRGAYVIFDSPSDQPWIATLYGEEWSDPICEVRLVSKRGKCNCKWKPCLTRRKTIKS